MDKNRAKHNRMIVGIDVTPDWWRALTPSHRRRDPIGMETAAASMLARVFRVATERGLVIERLELNEGHFLVFLYAPLDGAIGRIEEHRDALLQATADVAYHWQPSAGQ